MPIDGEKVPTVFFPRYSTFTLDPGGGLQTFSTTPFDMLPYSSYTMTFWRGEGVEVDDLTFFIMESADLINWMEIAQVQLSTAGQELVDTTAPRARFIRCDAKVLPTGSGTVSAINVWSTGYVHKTEA